MQLFYYSFSQKKFLPLLSSREGLLRANRYRTTEKGAFFVPLIWIAVAAGGSMFVRPVREAVLSGAAAAAFKVLVPITDLIFKMAGLFLTTMGAMLDFAIQQTISSQMYSDLAVIQTGWTTVRDFSNMFFIFALLYIAIKTILGLGGGSTKRWVANLIIAALLINFSLFATRVVVDAGNVLAIGFWDKMQITKTMNGTTETSSSAFMHLQEGLKLQSSKDITKADGTRVTEVDDRMMVVMNLGGAILMFVAGYVFLAGAIMMIIRTVTIIMCMILSPFAFLGFGLPTYGGFAQKWLDKLTGATFVAPAFLAMLYLAIRIINSTDKQLIGGAQNMSIGALMSGDLGSLPVIYNYIVMIMLLLASLTVANAVGNGVGAGAGGFAKKAMGYGALGGAVAGGMMGRQFGGRFGKVISESETLKKMAGNKNSAVLRTIGNLSLAGGEKMKKGTWDLRNAPGVNKGLGMVGVSAGAGSKKSYATHGGKLVGTIGAATVAGVTGLPGYNRATRATAEWAAQNAPSLTKAATKAGSFLAPVGKAFTKAELGTDREKEYAAIAAERYKTDPKAREQYLRDRGVDLDAARNKDLKGELARANVTTDAKKAVTDALKETTINAEGAKKIADSLALLSGKEVADFLTQDQLKKPEVIRALQSKDLHALNAKAAELSPETIKQITEGVAQNGTASARQFITAQTKVAGQFSFDAEARLKDLTAQYEAEEAKLHGNQITQDQFDAFAKTNKDDIGNALGMAGGAEAIKKMDDGLLLHRSVIAAYNKKLAGEIRKEMDAEVAREFDLNLKEFNSHYKAESAANQRSARDAAAERSAPKATVIVPPTNPPASPPLSTT